MFSRNLDYWRRAISQHHMSRPADALVTRDDQDRFRHIREVSMYERESIGPGDDPTRYPKLENGFYSGQILPPQPYPHIAKPRKHTLPGLSRFNLPPPVPSPV